MLSNENRLSLRGSLVPPDAFNLTAEHDRIVKNAVEEVLKLSIETRIQQDRESGHPLRPRLLDDVWRQGLLDWLSFLFEHYYPQSDSDPSRWDVISHVSSILAYFINAHSKEIFSKNGRQCLWLALRLWFVTDYDHTRAVHSLIAGWWAPFLACTSSVHVKAGVSAHTVRDEVLASDDTITAHDLVRSILKRLNASEDVKNSSYQQYNQLVISLTTFMDFQSSMSSSMNRTLRIMVRTLRRMVDSLERRPHPIDGYVDACIKFLFVLKQKLHVCNSIDAVDTAVNEGLLFVFVDFSKYLDWIMENFDRPFLEKKNMITLYAFELLTKVMPKYMHSAGVLLSMSPTMDEEEDDCCWDKIVGTIAGHDWHQLCNLYHKMIEIAIHDKYPFISFCDNPKHDVYKMRDTVKRCSGCRSFWYCSKECQRDDWERSHRPICAGLGETSRPLYHIGKLSPKYTVRSYCRFAIIAVQEDLKQFSEMAKKKYPHSSLTSDLTIVIDYTEYPPLMDIKRRDAIGNVAALAYDEATVIQCKIPLGPRVAVITTAGDLDDLENKVWFAGRSMTQYE